MKKLLLFSLLLTSCSAIQTDCKVEWSQGHYTGTYVGGQVVYDSMLKGEGLSQDDFDNRCLGLLVNAPKEGETNL